MLDEIAKESSEEKKPPGHRPAPPFCLNFGARIATSDPGLSPVHLSSLLTPLISRRNSRIYF